MHIEVQVALNFVISYLYNKLPRRRVNIFGEELERALKDKFRGHWYPEKPFRGSAFRCLKTGDPVDPVLERAARESGVPVQDILENLPHELAVWVDPGEVSYRIGEKGAVKILFSDKHDLTDDHLADREVTKTFNPEAQCFRPIEAMHQASHQQHHVVVLPPNPVVSQPPSPFEQVANGLGALGAMGAIGQPVPTGGNTVATPLGQAGVQVAQAAASGVLVGTPSSAPSPIPYKGSPSPVTPFLPRSSAPLTFTTATFAQTKFGSTKLKTNSKRANRMSPTEFSNYIKQRAMQQQQQQQQQQLHHHAVGPVGHHHLPPSQLSPQGSAAARPLSPNILADHSSFFFPAAQYQQQQQQQFGAAAVSPRGLYDSASGHGPSPFLDVYPSSKGYSSFLDHHSSFYSSFGSGAPTPGPTSSGLSAASSSGGGSGSHSPGVIGGGGSSSSSSGLGSAGSGSQSQSQAEKQLLEGFSNFSLGPHPSNSQYQHLLVAN